MARAWLFQSRLLDYFCVSGVFETDEVWTGLGGSDLSFIPLRFRGLGEAGGTYSHENIHLPFGTIAMWS